MRATFGIVCAAVFELAISLAALAQPAPQGGGPGAGGPGGGPGGFGRSVFRFGPERNALAEVLSVLGDANLSPDFNLSAEQKQKIQAIRDEFKKQQEAWRTEHAEDLKKLDEQMAEIRNAGGPPDPDQMRQMMEARHELMSTAPDGEDQAQEVKALLTPDQVKRFDARQAEIEQERERMMLPFGGPGGKR
jgi:hypothetical protein